VRKSEALHAATTLASPQSLLGSPSLEVPSLPGGEGLPLNSDRASASAR